MKSLIILILLLTPALTNDLESTWEGLVNQEAGEIISITGLPTS